MAGKKQEGIAGLKGTEGGQRRDDRSVANRTAFDPINIDAKNALTVIYMLKSPEDQVVLRAISSLEVYGQKKDENLRTLTVLGIFPHLLPLVRSTNVLIKRFAQKLIGMLCSLEEFRDQMLEVDNILNMFVDILETDPDIVMHEYAALTLAELSNECEAAANLLKVENCIPTLFSRITSPDPDVQKNCLDIILHLLNDVNGIEAFAESAAFDIKDIIAITSSSYPVLQLSALEVLKLLVSWNRDTSILFAFRDAAGFEMTLDILENQEWNDLHTTALELIILVADCPDLCDYLLQSGCLLRMVNLLDSVEDDNAIEKILGVLARMAQTQKGRTALHKVEMPKIFCDYLASQNVGILEQSSLAIAYLAQYFAALDEIMNYNPIQKLLDILMTEENNFNLRNLAAYAINILCTEDRRASEALIQCKDFELLNKLLMDNEKLPVELCKNVIQIYIALSSCDCVRMNIISEPLLEAILSCVQSDPESPLKDSSLQVDALECLSGYLIESAAQSIFNCLDGSQKIIGCLKSRYASVREWAGQMVMIMSENEEFVRTFIKNDGLNWLLQQKSTRYSMPSWNSAIESILSSFLPAKFAFTGRLEFHDITKNGFFISSRPSKFILVEEYIENMICPIVPLYIANFEIVQGTDRSESVGELSVKSDFSTSKSQQQSAVNKEDAKPMSLNKYMKGADRNSGEVYKWTGSLNTYESVDYQEDRELETLFSDNYTRLLPDPYLNDYLANLKKRIATEEAEYGDCKWFCLHPKFVRQRARIIAEFVAEEMSGIEPNKLCTTNYKEKHINEIKVQLGTTIIPLGFIRMGDYLERALLFKVLSDRVGFPCALVRGSYGRAWVEIAVPVLNIQEPESELLKELSISELKSKSSCKILSKSSESQPSQSITDSKNTVADSSSSVSQIEDENFWFSKLHMECFKEFPQHFLKPNSIVDLIEKPGRIFEIDSLEAKEYCGTFLFKK